MGMFDSVFVRCPKCSNKIEFQSKAGDCFCYKYTLYDCPDIIAADLNGEYEYCPGCNERVILTKPKLIAIIAEEEEEDEEL